MTTRYVTAARLRELSTQLSDRDNALIQRVSDLRFVSGSQLTRLHFAGCPARTAREALLRLTHLGFLERLPRPIGGVRSGSAGFIYRLGPVGQKLAGELGWQSKRRLRSEVPGTLFVRHALQAGELHTLLIEAERSGRLELLALEAEPACWRRYGGQQAGTLKPDSYVRLGVGEFEDSYFIEVDMGTEGSRALDSKLRQYVEYEASGREQAERGVFPKVLWTVPDTERAEVIKACVERLPYTAQELFVVARFSEAVRLLADSGAGGGLPDREKIEVGSRRNT